MYACLSAVFLSGAPTAELIITTFGQQTQLFMFHWTGGEDAHFKAQILPLSGEVLPWKVINK